MKFISLASGSRGNCAVIKTNRTTLLLDCGIGIERIVRGLERLQIPPNSVDGILITHEHTDHVSGLSAFAKKFGCDIYSHQKARLPVAYKANIMESESIKTFDRPFTIKDIYVEFAPLSHDSAHCVGYRISDDYCSISAVTDLGTVDDKAMGIIKDSAMVLIESNHDEVMLREGEYPPHLKKRIAGALGHLSNRQAAEVLVKLPNLNIRKALLGHISLNNNTSELVFLSAINALTNAGIKEGRDIDVDVIVQNKISEIYDVEKL